MSPRCDNCVSHVSKSFIRVFGQNGHLAACMNCNETWDMSNGKGIPEAEQ
jgi:hypothetical protein